MSTYPDDNPKTKFGVTKPPLHLVPATGVIHEAMAFGDGEGKYGAYNWREKTVSSTTYVGACRRHLDAWFNGEDFDPDSGVHHLGHARACLNIILDAETMGCLNDNRPPGAPVAELMRSLTRPLEPKPHLVDRACVNIKPCLLDPATGVHRYATAIQEPLEVPVPEPSTECGICGVAPGFKHAGWCGGMG